jgi:hypothetical protein
LSLFEVTLDANPSGGTPPYTFLWNPGGATTTAIVVPGDGVTVYDVLVTDNNGCTATDIWGPVQNCGGPQPEPSLTMNIDGSQHVVVPHDPATTRYHVYTNPFATFSVAGDEYGSPAGVCLVPFTPDVPVLGEATVDYVLPSGQWMLITAATDSPGSESTVGVDSAGTERSTVGTWAPMCGP